MRVMYMDGVGPFGGASRSLFEAVRALPDERVSAYFLATRGTSLDFYRQVATEMIDARGLSRFDNTLYSHYRGKRWLVLLREMGLIPSSVAAVRQAHRRWGSQIDVIHVNEVLELFPALLAKRIFRKPLVVHVRSVQNARISSWRYRMICDLLRRHADAIIAIDENVRASLPSDLPVEVIHNSFTPTTAPQPDTAMIEALEALPRNSLKVGFVGNLHHSKGLFEMVEAARIVVDRGCDVDFVIVGGTTSSDKGARAVAVRRGGFAQNVQQELHQRSERMGVADRFHLLGATKDIQSVYNRIDVICFASHYDAPGRPIFEAAFAGVPAIAAIQSPFPDTLVPGKTGIAIAPKDAQALAESIIQLERDRSEVERMGRGARELASQNFNPEKNSLKLLSVYERLKFGSVHS